MSSRRAPVLAAGLVAAAGGAAAYVRWIRPWLMHWGATDEEIARSLPGDALVGRPTWNATRAVTVEATPQQIWPWLLQLGWGRAGWYGYDWADNGGKPSLWQILPEHQHLEVGKDFPMSPFTAMVCTAFEEGAWMVWRGQGAGASAGTWVWYLDALDASHTRLITRMRDEYRWTSPYIIIQLAVDLLDFPFMRKAMLGIKARAEATARGEILLPD